MKSCLLLLAALAIVACGGPTSGDIVEKKYREPYTYTAFHSQYSGQTCSGIGTSRTCSSNYIQIPYIAVEPEHYRLKLRNGEDEGWVTVDSVTWHRVEVGQHYGRDS